jgi:hypothetical protein
MSVNARAGQRASTIRGPHPKRLSGLTTGFVRTPKFAIGGRGPRQLCYPGRVTSQPVTKHRTRQIIQNKPTVRDTRNVYCTAVLQ